MEEYEEIIDKKPSIIKRFISFIIRLIIGLIKLICLLLFAIFVGVIAYNHIFDTDISLDSIIQEFQPAPASIESIELSEYELEYDIFNDELQYYCYSTLSQDEKKIYLIIADAIMNQSNSVTFTSEEVYGERVTSIWQCVHSDLYDSEYVSSLDVYQSQYSTYYNTLVEIEYRCSSEEIAQQKLERETCTQEFFNNIDSQATDYEKVKAVYEYIVLNTEYVETEYDQIMYGVLVDKEGVCAGYSRAAQYLLNYLGVSCSLVSGTTSLYDEDSSHAWNLVVVEGEYYYFDTTWGDPNYSYSDGLESNGEQINYDYLLVRQQDMQDNHFPNDYITWPNTTAIEYNYYYYEGLYIDNYSETALVNIFKQSIGEDYYYFRAGNITTYSQIRWELETNKSLSSILQKAGFTKVDSYVIIYNENMYTFSIWLIYND